MQNNVTAHHKLIRYPLFVQITCTAYSDFRFHLYSHRQISPSPSFRKQRKSDFRCFTITKFLTTALIAKEGQAQSRRKDVLFRILFSGCSPLPQKGAWQLSTKRQYQ